MDSENDRLTGFHLFAYGTLRSDQPEGEIFQDRLISCTPARIQGRLYVLPEGYPVLEISPHQIISVATDDPFSDWERAIKKSEHSGKFITTSQSWIEGELLTFPLEHNVFESMDAWEGFSPAKDSLYQRVITQAYDNHGKRLFCWAYVSTSTPELPIRPLNASRWQRPNWMK